MGKIKYNGYSSTITLIFNLISFPLMINWMGLTGAAYATIASGIVIYTSSVFFFKKAVAKTNWEE
jgi:Na+-driven multidrug efflux pump